MTYTQRHRTNHLPTRASLEGKGLGAVEAIESAYNVAAQTYVEALQDMSERILSGHEPTDTELDALQGLANTARAYDRVMGALNALTDNLGS